jgi:acyl-coenzyme A synthetase/AMP-(fatty) acid ligase
MGHRIELGEIEVNVNMLDGVKLSGCIYDDEKGKIVVYYVGDITDKELTIALKEKLPRYMVPNRIIKLDNMPLTANGKIDRVTLKRMYKDK